MGFLSRVRIGETALLAALFLLPWQTRWIFGTPTLHGGPWEYGVMSLYVVEILVWIAAAFLWRPKTNVCRPLAIFALALVASALVGVNSSVSLAFLIHIASAGLLVFAMAARKSWMGMSQVSSHDPQTRTIPRPKGSADVKEAEARPIQDLRAAFLAGLVLPALFGWAQVLTGTQFASTELGLAAHSAADLGVAVIETPVGRMLRAYGPFSHPNVFGGYLVVGLLLCVWLDIQLKSRARLANAFLAAFLAATLIITFSRSAFLALMLGVWLCRPLVKRNYALHGLLVGLLVAGIWFHGPFLSRADTSNRLEGKSVQERASQYAEFGRVFVRAPWFGTGSSGYTAALGEVFPDRASWELQPVHNTFLLFLAEQGLFGALALAWLLSRLVKQNGRRLLPLAVLLPIALLDHYLWSSWAGLALISSVWLFLPCFYAPAKQS